MNDIEIKLLNAKLYLNYYKNNNILDRYATIIERLVIDNDCLSVLKNPNEKLYITPLSKNVNKEEKYKNLEQIEKEHKEENGRLRKEIDKKDKIINEMKWKPISKYNRKEYDWVLVKYFDGDYECVPDVAEKRSDDRWYNSSGEIIPFEVKYFFDMQILDYFTNKVEEDIKE